ncbi:MAG: ABC transporter permease [Chloroflexi bacterium CFX6]|nr:ABC transporter permease [Chloroflexi bacterium CFX6]
MSKLWRVARYEYARHVLQRRFLATLLGLPLFLVLIAAVTWLIAVAQRDARPVGYVDLSGFLADAAPPTVEDARPGERAAGAVRAFASELEARAALEAGDIQGYYVLPVDFRATAAGTLVYLDDQPSAGARRSFDARLRAAWLAGLPPATARRVADGVTFVTPARGGGDQPMWVSTLVNVGLPIFVGIVFISAIFATAGYLMHAVVEEKENRTIEVLATSVAPGTLIAGKIAGITAVGLTQIGIWSVLGLAGLAAARPHVAWLGAVAVEPRLVASMAATMLPAYVMIAALMVAVGATVAEASEANQITGIFTLPVMLPYWFAGQIVPHPDSPLAIGLTLFPLTAPVTISLRAGATEIPAWQMVGHTAFLTLSAAAAVWLAGRAFRLGLLRVGARVRWAEVLGRT